MNKKRCYFLIRISKTGYITKIISKYNRIPEKLDKLYPLDFKTELIEERKPKKLNSNALDFSNTIIHYDESANCFILMKNAQTILKDAFTM